MPELVGLQFVDEHGGPVQGYVTFLPSGITAPIRNGLSEIDWEIASGGSGFIIIPTDGHWITNYKKIEQTRGLLCPRASDTQIDWWRSATGLRLRKNRRTNFKVGILDTGFTCRSGITPDHIDLNGMIEEPFLRDGSRNELNHGFGVYQLMLNSGVFKPENIVVSDISSAFYKNKGSLHNLTIGIMNLIDQFKVDFINISYGFYFDSNNEGDLEARELLLTSIKYATSRGCIVFAAVGNDAETSPAVPASSESTIGVGSIGKCGIAPINTIGFYREGESAGVPESEGASPSGELFFHDATTCYGVGLDIVAPGVSVFARCGNDLVIELFGTSFACPVALSTVAAILAREPDFEDLPLEWRYSFVRRHLPEWCHDLGIGHDRQGSGLLAFVEM